MRVLIVHWHWLEPDTNSGDLRLYEIIRLLREAGHRVVFIPGSFQSGDPPRCLRTLGVASPRSLAECIKNPDEFGLLLLRQNFGCAILSPFHVFGQMSGPIRGVLPQCALILDTIDLFHVREQRQAALSGDPRQLERARQTYEAEWQCLRAADAVWVVTETERERLAPSLGTVSVVPNIHRVATSVAPYEKREGVVFLGGYGHPPNVDAVEHFVRAILPAIRRSLPSVPVWIAGSHPPEPFAAFERDSGVRVTGYVPDHRSLLGSCRVGIAPLRYGAGMKGKIGEYLACGLPTVTTSVGAEGMDLRDGVEAVVADDPAVFAQRVVDVYTDRVLWNGLSSAGPRYIERTLSPEAVSRRLDGALAQALAANRRKCEEGALVPCHRLSATVRIMATKLRRKLRGYGPTAD